jgi:hypothetical protein
MTTSVQTQTNWRKATASNGGGACLELATWRKARASDINDCGNCVELATDTRQLGVRDSKSPSSGTLVLPDGARSSLVSFARDTPWPPS